MKKIFKIINNCFITFVIIVLFFNLIVSFFGKEDTFKISRYSFLDVNGDSMYPRIKNGDFIAIDTKKKDKYDVNDVISYKKKTIDGTILVTHKIKEVIENENGYKYVTEGINNPKEDEGMVSNNEIIGEYKNFRIPLLGHLVKFSRTKIGYLVLVILPLGAMLLWASYELIEEISKKKGEK